ncbi:MAG TPA: FAD-dependent oxidoreductase [Gemmatimonadaceae bacterium]|nr:FAD-dependent oxidoreductase [Gemmatimonadaceae bacterium]
MTTRRPDAIVVGAGIVGAACAAAFARDGLRVLVLDAAGAALGTTSAGMGHLVVMDDSPGQLALTHYSTRLWESQDERLRVASELEWCGTVWVAEDDVQMDAVRSKQRLYAGQGIASEVLDDASLLEAEPHLRQGLAGGLLVPSDGVIYPPAAAVALLESARANGADVRERSPVDEIVANGVRCGGETIHAEVVVNAAGAAAATLTPGLSVVPRKGHLIITERHPGFCRHQIVELGYLTSAHVMTGESVAFNVQPRITGQVLIGSSRELVGWNATVNRRVLGRMVERACEFMPGLANLTAARTWTGFRPATPDKLPLIGRWPDTPGLWIAAGHEGLGITTSLGTAALLGDLVAGRATAIDAAPYAPDRGVAAEVH